MGEGREGRVERSGFPSIGLSLSSSSVHQVCTRQCTVVVHFPRGGRLLHAGSRGGGDHEGGYNSHLSETLCCFLFLPFSLQGVHNLQTRCFSLYFLTTSS